MYDGDEEDTDVKEELVGLTFGPVFDRSPQEYFFLSHPWLFWEREQKKKISRELGEEGIMKILPKGEIYHNPQRICSIMKGVIIMECCECLFIDEGSFFFITFSMERNKKS